MENKPYIKVKKNNETVGMVQTPTASGTIVGIKEESGKPMYTTDGLNYKEFGGGGTSKTPLYEHHLSIPCINPHGTTTIKVVIVSTWDEPYMDCLTPGALLDGKAFRYGEEYGPETVGIIKSYNGDVRFYELIDGAEAELGGPTLRDITSQVNVDGSEDSRFEGLYLEDNVIANEFI